jgi:hypothetical protein
VTVFSDDPKDLARSLGEMHRLARERCWQNQVEAKETMKGWLQHDRRFDAFDKDRLVERVQEASYNGRTLDLDDPFLRRGGDKRPLSF